MKNTQSDFKVKRVDFSNERRRIMRETAIQEHRKGLINASTHPHSRLQGAHSLSLRVNIVSVQDSHLHQVVEKALNSEIELEDLPEVLQTLQNQQGGNVETVIKCLIWVRKILRIASQLNKIEDLLQEMVEQQFPKILVEFLRSERTPMLQLEILKIMGYLSLSCEFLPVLLSCFSPANLLQLFRELVDTDSPEILLQMLIIYGNLAVENPRLLYYNQYHILAGVCHNLSKFYNYYEIVNAFFWNLQQYLHASSAPSNTQQHKQLIQQQKTVFLSFLFPEEVCTGTLYPLMSQNPEFITAYLWALLYLIDSEPQAISKLIDKQTENLLKLVSGSQTAYQTKILLLKLLGEASFWVDLFAAQPFVNEFCEYHLVEAVTAVVKEQYVYKRAEYFLMLAQLMWHLSNLVVRQDCASNLLKNTNVMDNIQVLLHKFHEEFLTNFSGAALGELIQISEAMETSTDILVHALWFYSNLISVLHNEHSGTIWQKVRTIFLSVSNSMQQIDHFLLTCGVDSICQRLSKIRDEIRGSMLNAEFSSFLQTCYHQDYLCLLGQ